MGCGPNAADSGVVECTGSFSFLFQHIGQMCTRERICGAFGAFLLGPTNLDISWS